MIPVLIHRIMYPSYQHVGYAPEYRMVLNTFAVEGRKTCLLHSLVIRSGPWGFCIFEFCYGLDNIPLLDFCIQHILREYPGQHNVSIATKLLARYPGF